MGSEAGRADSRAATGLYCSCETGGDIIKVLYVSVYRDNTGYSHAAIDYILALDAAGVDVVCRPVKLNGAKPELPKRILELEAKESAGSTHCITHLLPNMMDYNGRFEKNIGLFACETDNFKASVWAERLNLMDEVWVINKEMVEACVQSGVTRPIHVVPHACDTTKYERRYEPLPIPGLDENFTFYFIGEFNRRKNLAALLKAFHLEFDPSEPVQLLLKTSPVGIPRPQQADAVKSFCNEIKRGLKLYADINAYKSEIVVLDELSELDIMRLHASCDCFASASYGEAWCIPAFDAMAMGKTPIITNGGGPAEYLRLNDRRAGYLVEARKEPAFGMVDTFRDLYTGSENWWSVDINDLRRCMRLAYEDWHTRHILVMRGRDVAYRYSHLNVGNLMKGLLA